MRVINSNRRVTRLSYIKSRCILVESAVPTVVTFLILKECKDKWTKNGLLSRANAWYWNEYLEKKSYLTIKRTENWKKEETSAKEKKKLQGTEKKIKEEQLLLTFLNVKFLNKCIYSFDIRFQEEESRGNPGEGGEEEEDKYNQQWLYLYVNYFLELNKQEITKMWMSWMFFTYCSI